METGERSQEEKAAVLAGQVAESVELAVALPSAASISGARSRPRKRSRKDGNRSTGGTAVAGQRDAASGEVRECESSEREGNERERRRQLLGCFSGPKLLLFMGRNCYS